VPAYCHLTSHCTILSFASPGCPVTPCCATISQRVGCFSSCLLLCCPLVCPGWLLHHPSMLPLLPIAAVHCAVTAVAHCNCAAIIDSLCINIWPLSPIAAAQRCTPQLCHHLTVHCITATIAHRDCAAACTGTSIVASPVVTPPTLNAPDGCHIASCCATLSFNPAGCCINYVTKSR
jgi:hypothetical protein